MLLHQFKTIRWTCNCTMSKKTIVTLYSIQEPFHQKGREREITLLGEHIKYLPTWPAEVGSFAAFNSWRTIGSRIGSPSSVITGAEINRPLPIKGNIPRHSSFNAAYCTLMHTRNVRWECDFDMDQVLIYTVEWQSIIKFHMRMYLSIAEPQIQNSQKVNLQIWSYGNHWA